MEFVGILPLLVLGALACLQALAIAITLVLAQHSVDRAAQPGATTASVAQTLPAAWRASAQVHRRADDVELSIKAPVVLPGAGRYVRLHVHTVAVQP